MPEQIRAGGLEFTDGQRACFLLTGLLGTEFDNLVKNIETAENVAQLTTQRVKTKLTLEELRLSREDNVDARALAIQGKKNYFFKKQYNKNDEEGRKEKEGENEVRRPWTRNVVCFSCGKKGHVSRSCPEFKEKKTEEERKVVETKALRVIYGSVKKASCKDLNVERRKYKFFIDSGATHHMSPHRNLFSELEPCGGHVSQADDTKLAVEGIGQVRFSGKTETGDCVPTFSDVLYVPEMADNLISSRMLDKKGVRMVIFKGVCTGYDGDTNEILFQAQANDEDNMYIREGKVEVQATALKAGAWHDRFGHQCKLPDVKGVSTRGDEKLKVFGCRAYYADLKKPKLGPRGKKAVFLGYEEDQKGWRLLDDETSKIVVSCDVHFEENVFPFREDADLQLATQEEFQAEIRNEGEEYEVNQQADGNQPETGTGTGRT
ncbi:Retrovirus-related Pol polyprotein from transposon TNT 1-94, partial [Frankliniella fusca]